MVGFLLTIVGEIIAGVAVFYLTEGSTRSGNNQTVYIQNNTYNFPAIGVPYLNNESSEDEVWGWIIVFLFVFGLFIISLVAFSALYIQHINTILTISFWAAILMAVVATLLLIIGIFKAKVEGDWSVFQVAIYSLVLCGVIGGLVWLIYAQPNAPEGFDEIYFALQALDLKASNWMSTAIDIGTGDQFLTINPVVKYIALQACGVIPMFLTILFVLLNEIKITRAVLQQENQGVSSFALIAAPIAAFISSLFLGLFR